MKPASEQPEGRWDAQLDLALKQLPDRTAPRTLIPRVLAALEAKARLPWYRRAWWHWPPAVQIMSVLGIAALLGVMAWLATHSGQVGWGTTMVEVTGKWLSPLTPLWTLFSALVESVALVLRGLGGWILLGGALFCGVMYLSCVGFGTMVYRIAFFGRNV